MGRTGWFKFHRQIFDNPICTKDAEHFFVWCYLLAEAEFEDGERVLFQNEEITLKKGQLLRTINQIANDLHIKEMKVYRILKLLENEKQIVKQTSNKNTLITVLNWEKYQSCEKPNEEPMKNECKTDVKQMKNECKTDVKPSYYNKECNNERMKEYNICSNSDDLNETEKPKKNKTKLTEEENEELVKNFEIIYNSYPKKVGKASGFKVYKQWLNGRNIDGTKIKLTNRQMWYAIAKYKQYIEKEEMEPQYIKQFDTFMRNILDYVEDEQQ